MSTVTENERIRKLLQSYPVRAVTLLYDQYHESLQRISFSFTKDEEASKDIIQETFYHVWLNSEDLSKHHERSIQYYLVKVVKYKSISYYKKTRQLNLEKLRFMAEQHIDTDVSPLEYEAIENDIIYRVRTFVANLPKRQKESFLLQVDEGMTISQIAKTLKITPSGVEKNLTRAKKAIRKYLKRN